MWDDFINSYWRDWRTGDRSKDRDRLEEPAWLGQWMQEHALEAPLPPDPTTLAQLKQLRGCLWAAVQQLVQGAVIEQALIERLNLYMSKGPAIRQIAGSGDAGRRITLVPLYTGWEQIMSEIAASFAGVLLEKELSRIRICENPDCLWVYYDDTRNRSKRYCDDKMCGNLIKVRRFRARKKAEEHDKNGL
ncbi:MAG: hypothetical protein K0R57_176 [Paenibacillaceae bacterium]|nr:hypothetical protein [Paenibacillaceae bacterium]